MQILPSTFSGKGFDFLCRLQHVAQANAIVNGEHKSSELGPARHRESMGLGHEGF